jgi:transposase
MEVGLAQALVMQPVFARGDVRTIQNVLLWQRQAQTRRDPRLVIRLQAVRLSLEGRSAPEIARLLAVERTTVHGWICAWNQGRLDALLERPRSGRPSELNDAQKERLMDIVESGPVAWGLITGVWTSALLSHVIAEEFGVDYNPGHVRKLLGSLGASVQRPTARLVRADPKEQNKWLRHTWPDIKKGPRGGGDRRVRG